MEKEELPVSRSIIRQQLVNAALCVCSQSLLTTWKEFVAQRYRVFSVNAHSLQKKVLLEFGVAG